MRQQQELLRGTVNAVVFYNAENGYCVLRLQCEDGELTNVVGMIPMPVVGERLLITGHWVSHNTYGRQFEAEFLERLRPDGRSRRILPPAPSRASGSRQHTGSSSSLGSGRWRFWKRSRSS